MADHDDVDVILLDRYRAGECTPAECARIERWLAADASREAWLVWMRALEPAAAALPDQWEMDALWPGVQARLAEPVAAAVDPSAGSRRPVALTIERVSSWSTRLLRVAAAIGALAAGAALWRSGTLSSHRGTDAPAFRAFTTAAGERAVVTLADGSQVTIDAGTTLRVARDFGGAERNVQLDGRAYFEVAPDSARPFRVYTHGAVTRVLGTKFGVRAYSEDSTVSVVVREGRVALAALRGSAAQVTRGVVLTRDDLATLDAAGRIEIEHDATTDERLAWIEGRLEFLNAPIRQVLPELTRRYGLAITVADPRIDTLLWTASVREQSADEVLRLLAASLELTVERRGSRVVLRLPSSKGLLR